MFTRDVKQVGSDRKDQVPKAVYIQGVTKGGNRVLQLNEFGIDPLLRFFHERNIQPAHWICVAKRNLRKSLCRSKARFTFEIDWRNV